MLFDQPQQHGHAHEDAHRRRDGERPAARVDGREHEKEVVEEKFAVRKEAAHQPREAFKVDAHREEVRGQQREQKDEYEIFEHVAQRAADVPHEFSRTPPMRGAPFDIIHFYYTETDKIFQCFFLM